MYTFRMYRCGPEATSPRHGLGEMRPRLADSGEVAKLEASRFRTPKLNQLVLASHEYRCVQSRPVSMLRSGFVYTFVCPQSTRA
jgi:hypothetical protein